MLQRISRAQPDLAVAERPLQGGVEAETRPLGQVTGVIAVSGRATIDLEVGLGDGLIALDETAGRSPGARHRPGSRRLPFLDAGREFLVGHATDARLLSRMVCDDDVDVVLEVLADAGQIVDHLDAGPCEFVRRSDARQQQELRRVDGAGAEHDFGRGIGLLHLAQPQILDTDGAAVLDQQARRQYAGGQRQVRPVQDRAHEGARRAVSLAILDRELEQADAVLHRAVEVLVIGVAGRHGGIQIGALRGVDIDGIGDHQLAARAVQRAVGKAHIGFGGYKGRQHAFPVPAGIAERLPAVVVGRQSTDVDHGVERSGASEHLATRPEQLAIAGTCLRHRVVAPVDFAIE